MLRILLVLTTAALLGGALATGAMSWPVRPGLVGVALMLLSAAALRRYWGSLRHAAPESPERSAWLNLASTALIVGHLLAGLWEVGPALALHSLRSHAQGVDSWTLLLGGLLASWVVRPPEQRRDERDQHIAAQGLRAAYGCLLGLIAALALVLAFAPMLAPFSHALLAHLLIACALVAFLVQSAVQLRAYAQDARAEEPAQ